MSHGDNVIEKGMTVKVHYKGTLPENGEMFDSSEGRDPLKFTVGKGEMIPGFEEELMGATVGDKKTFTLSPTKHMGKEMRKPFYKFHVLNLPNLRKTALEIGFQLVAQMPHGPAPFTIADLSMRL